jgi:hypothetical protein
MSDNEIMKMRRANLDLYSLNFDPKVFGKFLTAFDGGRLLANAEEKREPFIYPRFVWPPPKS